MSTSGITSYTQNQLQICQSAIQLLGEVGTDQILNDNDLSVCANFLNMYIKFLQSQGTHLWKREEAVITLVPGQIQYNLNTIPAAEENNFVKTTLVSDASAGATSIVVSSVNDGFSIGTIQIGNQIGIELDSGPLQWVTVTGISSTTITLNSALTGSASSGNFVYSFQTQLVQPLVILEARRRDSSDLDIPINAMSSQEYHYINNKNISGTISSYYYDRQLNSGQLYIWQAPTDVKTRIHITFKKRLEIFQNGTDTPDFPDEWVLPLSYSLAAYIAPIFGKSNMIQILQPQAMDLMNKVMGFGDNDFLPIDVIRKSDPIIL